MLQTQIINVDDISTIYVNSSQAEPVTGILYVVKLKPYLSGAMFVHLSVRDLKSTSNASADFHEIRYVCSLQVFV